MSPLGIGEAALGQDPHRLLLNGVYRPDVAIKGKIALFLQGRDPNLLVTMLASDLNRRYRSSRQIDDRVVALLGDTTQQKREALRPDVFAGAIAALQAGMRPGEEAQSLLCCRYLLELGVPVAPEKVRHLAPAVRALVDTAEYTRTERVTVTSGDDQ